jgi:protein-disulfide isomerase
MRSSLNFILIVILLSALSVGQQTPATKPSLRERDKPAGPAPAAGLPSEATVDSFMQQTFGWEKDVTWKVSSIKPASVYGLAEVTVVLATPQGQQLSKFYVSADGEHALVGDIIPFGARPFDPAKRALEKGINGPQRGPKDSPVTIVEFSDLQCPACKAAQPAIEALIAANPTARFVFQNFPLDMHNWAAKGAAYADCVGRASNDAFWKFIAKTYESQADITAENADQKLTAIADASGVKGADIAACAVKPETKTRVDASSALGKAVDVTSTPTLFINGRKIGNITGIPPETLKGLVEFASNQGK